MSLRTLSHAVLLAPRVAYIIHVCFYSLQSFAMLLLCLFPTVRDTPCRTLILPVLDEKVGFPDSSGFQANAFRAVVVCRIPIQTRIKPFLWIDIRTT